MSIICPSIFYFCIISMLNALSILYILIMPRKLCWLWLSETYCTEKETDRKCLNCKKDASSIYIDKAHTHLHRVHKTNSNGVQNQFKTHTQAWTWPSLNWAAESIDPLTEGCRLTSSPNSSKQLMHTHESEISLPGFYSSF